MVLEDFRTSFFAFFGTLVIFFSSLKEAHVMIKGLDGSLFLAFARASLFWETRPTVVSVCTRYISVGSI